MKPRLMRHAFIRSRVQSSCNSQTSSRECESTSTFYQLLVYSSNESILTISGQFLELSVEGEMVPNFNKVELAGVLRYSL